MAIKNTMKSILKKGYHVYFIKTMVKTSIKIALKHSNSVTTHKKKIKRTVKTDFEQDIILQKGEIKS